MGVPVWTTSWWAGSGVQLVPSQLTHENANIPGTSTRITAWGCILDPSHSMDASDPLHRKHVAFPGRIYILGCGSIGQGTIPYAGVGVAVGGGVCRRHVSTSRVDSLPPVDSHSAASWT